MNATTFPFKLPSAPGPGGTQALATNTKDGGVLYDVAYSIVTVQDGAPVTNPNSAFAIAHCKACTTVAVSFQIVPVIGQSRIVAPINAAGALNYDCTACLTTAIADQIVVTLKSQPSKELAAQLAADLAGPLRVDDARTDEYVACHDDNDDYAVVDHDDDHPNHDDHNPLAERGHDDDPADGIVRPRAIRGF